MLDPRGGSPRPGRLRRGWGHAARALAWGLVFVASVLLGVLIHGNVPALRRAAIEISNRALDGKFRGHVTLGELEHLSPSSATLSRLELLDEHGASVLLLEGVQLRYRPWRWVLAWFSGSDAPLRFEHVRIERSRVALRSDPETQAWSLARALQSPRPPSARRPKPPAHYAFEVIELGEVAVSIDHPSIGQVEATVHHLQGSADLEGADASIALERFGLRLVAAGDVALDGTGSLRLLPHGYAAGTFHGFVDGTELELALELDGDQLAARVDVPHALPEQLQRRWPGWPLQSALTAHVTARGPVRAPRVEAHLEAGTSRVDAAGDVQLAASLRAQLSVQAHALDARLLWPGAPATQLDAQAALELERAAGGLLVRAQGTSEPSRIAEVALPGTRFSVRVDPERVLGTLELESARGQLRAEIQATGPGTAHLDLQAQRVDLQAWPELRGQLRGALELEAHAELQHARLSGTLEGTLSNLQAGAGVVRHTRLRGGWSGSIGDWDGFELDTSLAADGLRWGSSNFEHGSWTSRGKWSRSRFDAELSATSGARSRAHGVLELDADGASVRDLEASWSERELELSARASLLAPARRVLLVERFQISGAAGKLRGAARINPGAVDVSLDAEGLDTGRLSRTFGAGSLGHTGHLTGHAELSTDAHATRGNVDVELRDLAVRDLAMGTLDLRATLQDRRVELSLGSTESPLGQLEARATGTLAGSVLEPSSWQRATGDGSVTLKQLPLWPVGLVLPKRGTLQNLAGQLEVALQFERRAAQELPSVFLQASTQELSFSLDASRNDKPAPITFDQFALHASASLDGSSGHGAATVLVTDPKGALVTSSGSVELDLARLIANPAAMVEQLLHTPIDALLRLHARPLSQLPAPLFVPDLAGSVEATLQLAGTLSEPTLDLAVEGRGLLGSFAAGSDALAVSGLLHYVPSSGELTGRAQAARAGASLVSARLEGRVREQTAADSPFALAGWELGELRAAAMLNGVPLELWPAAARERFQAKLYGSVAVERHGSELRPSAYVEVGSLSVNGRALGAGHFKLESADAATHAELDIGPVEHRLRVRLEGRPGGAGVEGSLTATEFDVASLSPFVSDILSHLDGRVDANASFQLQPRPDAAYYLGINGHAELKGASLHLDLLGLELKDLGATLRARSTPDHTVILIDPVRAKSRSRKPNVEADAELWLEGVRLVSGEARVSLNDVPLSLKSTLRGTARGKLEGRLERKPDFMALEVKVPELRVALPASTTRSLIALDPNPDFHVGQVSETVPSRASDALLWKINFDLGKSVRVERSDLSLPLSGDPHLEYRDELRPSGSIEVRPGGRITLFDQNFNVDHGILSFDPDAAENPRLDVTASWRAPDGTTVYVDVTGRAQEASVLTRDDRGLQDIDRFYLLTGSPSPVGSSGAANSSESGINDRAALGQTFSLGINQLLRKSVGNVAVSVDTTADDRASYSASVRLSDRLSFQGSFRPPSETNREESTDLTGTLDYQISRRWSLRTELGTTGGAFDLLWSHRY